MQISTSKLTQKYQATVPATVRKKLNLHAGDVIAFEIEHDEIRLRKARPFDIEFSSALSPTLSEWESPNDEEAYNDL
ncbi:MAG TPA: AbrB/MazE/SpoVT family DNA-binding domain-containing protein [Candidatus Lambdaproteobacteria bacterium]|jgi:AbrB family looped-hinge helix DNA binding protein|uniref:AbrB family transcriptional regulator n=1 Tax=SAR324 cluster bacterium TaxID=2024889 RepID=A0A432GZH5_9DELT|nr:AbrB/MazE/SpoVT family DNA-binding domain-containing protein [SAR324 cluster bacterium]HBJ47083.1 AbrB family transcriptional regulator [Deltaproteobacteria bacterium]HHZ85678.1 AbrB/MazE/SpoVT family DNA-binding domain-containing protein [Candidatus Lambdaproteobacteria bacterium]MCH2282454.1 AbrB/MazE/SpoVT family DNA-binding domain-containing protein [SAR324 cluster bacterium]RTZ81035.1 MAG: AbrB family transcriptional regulator [SAR324 cluster bacterium]